MSWKIKKSLQKVLERENGAVTKDWGGKITIALVYPNSYRVGMGNLAIHSLYNTINSKEEFLCERFFLPEKQTLSEYKKTNTPLLSLENQRALYEFDVIAFSASFENDYTNILPILQLGKIEPLRSQRDENTPLLIVGGDAPTINPKTVSDIFDAIFVGEAESGLETLLETFIDGKDKRERIDLLERLEFIYTSEKDVASIKRSVTKDLNDHLTQTSIYSANAHFGDMHLIETMRGCPRQCKFCCTPTIFQPVRYRSFEAVKRMIDIGAKERKKFGLIGADLGGHPAFDEIVDYIHSKGFSFSPSSLRVDAIDERMAEHLKRSRISSVSLGIEAGNEAQRKRIGKPIAEERIIKAVEHLKTAGINHLRLYFMIGLPDETRENISSIASLTLAIAKTFDRNIDLTITTFVPKPTTPWADMPFVDLDYYKEAKKAITEMLKKSKTINTRFEPYQNAKLEYTLSHGTHETIKLLQEIDKI
ncbi:MAG: radical SAM protein [Pseudomonadota bacterium]